MDVSQKDKELLNLIKNTQQIIKIEDNFMGNNIKKVIHIKTNTHVKKTIILHFAIKHHDSKEKVPFFGIPCLSLTREIHHQRASLQLVTLMIKNHEYKYYYNYDADMINRYSTLEIEKRFNTTWNELESKLHSHYPA